MRKVTSFLFFRFAKLCASDIFRSHGTVGPASVPAPGIWSSRVKKLLPLCFLLAGCTTTYSIDATKMDQLQNTYELAHRSMWLSVLNTRGEDDLRRSIAATAQAVCGQAGVAILDVNRPDYISLPMTPRGYLHCHSEVLP